MTDQNARVIALYSTMPGAPLPPKENGYFLWGEVEGNDHWNFCATIILDVDAAIGAAVSRLASDHELV